MEYIIGLNILVFIGAAVYIARFWIQSHYSRQTGLTDRVYQLEQVVKEINHAVMVIRERTGL